MCGSRSLVCDVRGNIVETIVIPVLEKAIKFADTFLDVELETIKIGEQDGNALFGLMPSLGSPHFPTEADQAAIGAYVRCCEENDEILAHQQLESKIDSLAAQAQRIEIGINAVLARLGHPAAQDIADSLATGAELVENIEAIARPGSRAGGTGKIAGKKSSAKRSA